ncbi:MAG TPA: PilZ domain-containing protein, partial [Terriglobales bacterium]|nr:PilZ domain-containing protein [Terriglobales bacterium]
MSNNGRFAEDGNPGAGAEVRAQDSSASPASRKAARARYPDMQSAVRFPIKLPISVKSKSGANAAETENISANGVLFHVDSEMPIGSMVDF